MSTVGLFHPVETKRTFEAVLEQIVERIRDGHFREGDPLPGERRLAAALAVSRPTVREAIRILVEAGVLEVSGNATVVRSVWIPDELLEQQTELRAGEILDVLEARRLMEPAVARLAALRARGEDFAAMRESIELMRQNRHDPQRFLQADMLFHRAIARATRNATLEPLMQRLFQRLAVARDMAARTELDVEWAIDIHERTLAAIESRDSDRVDAAMDEHMSYLERLFEQGLGRGQRRPHVLVKQREGGRSR